MLPSAPAQTETARLTFTWTTFLKWSFSSVPSGLRSIFLQTPTLLGSFVRSKRPWHKDFHFINVNILWQQLKWSTIKTQKSKILCELQPQCLNCSSQINRLEMWRHTRCYKAKKKKKSHPIKSISVVRDERRVRVRIRVKGLVFNIRARCMAPACNKDFILLYGKRGGQIWHEPQNNS